MVETMGKIEMRKYSEKPSFIKASWLFMTKIKVIITSKARKKAKLIFILELFRKYQAER